MDDIAIEKFINTMQIVVNIKPDRYYIDSRGKRNVCIQIKAYYKSELSYEQYHCYETTNVNLISYSEGNEVKGVRDSIFAYLGEDDEVDRYFEEIARKKAKKFFNERFKYDYR